MSSYRLKELQRAIEGSGLRDSGLLELLRKSRKSGSGLDARELLLVSRLHDTKRFATAKGRYLRIFQIRAAFFLVSALMVVGLICLLGTRIGLLEGGLSALSVLVCLVASRLYQEALPKYWFCNSGRLTKLGMAWTEILLIGRSIEGHEELLAMEASIRNSRLQGQPIDALVYREIDFFARCQDHHAEVRLESTVEQQPLLELALGAAIYALVVLRPLMSWLRDAHWGG